MLCFCNISNDDAMPQITNFDVCDSSQDQNLALCSTFCLDHLLDPHSVGLLVGHSILLDLSHILLDLWLRLFEEPRPKQFDNGFIEESQSPAALGLVENLEVDRPELSLVRRNKIENRRHQTLPPHNSMRIYH